MKGGYYNMANFKPVRNFTVFLALVGTGGLIINELTRRRLRIF